MSHSRLLVVVLLAIFVCVSCSVSAQQANPSPKSGSLQASGTLTGTVVTGIVTPGGDCPHRYWLKTDPVTKGGDSSLIALEPESKTLAGYVNKKVKLEGTPKMCHGVEIDVVVFVIKHIVPGE